MFSLANAITRARNTNRPSRMIVRRISPNARMRFSTDGSLLARVGEAGSAQAAHEAPPRACCRVISPRRWRPSRRAQTIQNLVIAISLQTDLTIRRRSDGDPLRHPRRHGAVAFAHDRVQRHRWRVHRGASANDEVGEHSWPQFVLRILDLRADCDAARIGIDGRADGHNVSCEHSTR